jgi:VWFA-related protein
LVPRFASKVTYPFVLSLSKDEASVRGSTSSPRTGMRYRNREAQRLVAGPALLAIFVGSAALAQDGAQPDQTAQRRLVTVDVAVERSDGTFVPGLRPEDFEIVSDGESCPVESFSTEARPVTTVALFDVSGSCWIQPAVLRTAVEKRLIPALGPNDRMRLGVIGAGPSTLAPRFSSDRRDLAASARMLNLPPALSFRNPTGPVTKGLVGVSGGTDELNIRPGPSPIWDAVYAAVAALEPEAGCRAIILVTDGRSTANVRGLDEVIDRAMAAAVSVNIVTEENETLIPLDQTTAARVRPGTLLEALASSTGGAYLSAVDAVLSKKGNEPVADTIGAVLESVQRRLHQTYALGFSAPQPDDRLHRLEVRVKVPGLTARARKGYVPAPKAPGGSSARALAQPAHDRASGKPE